MMRYFFDLRSGDVVSPDDEGRMLEDIEAAHQEAVGSLTDVARRSGWEGAAIWMASQCRGEVMIAAQIVARKSFVEL